MHVEAVQLSRRPRLCELAGVHRLVVARVEPVGPEAREPDDPTPTISVVFCDERPLTVTLMPTDLEPARRFLVDRHRRQEARINDPS